ncbi:hypothetical protein LQ567_22045 [Niabella pedocola]|uniref:non-reducing end alpha-L-arabinofuranosidase n=1 Tax=Niabella pedocola TaxID=1752077 RepID=A0ABS8PWN2_9BACT|nr:alpha-L-arabinofuranosidase C-terminal domain-containing protein [Niabella pedocola]MCD2425482.1 hypothetical protein [Niabella pedocola]
MQKTKIAAGIALMIWMTGFGTATAQKTRVTITIPEQRIPIDPMIYGQMLENVNDSVIYGGVTDGNGNVQPHITKLLKELDIPVMRWPGGTVIHEYRWRDGIGPRRLRPVVSTYAWKGKENYQFGTDEFLNWCKEINTQPYINFNMANHPLYGGTLWEAMDWIEYVNGTADTTNGGRLRAAYGHKEPYNVQYWGIGNENYGPWGRHNVETAAEYGNRLALWAGTIRNKYPGLRLLGVGHTLDWNRTVLEKSGKDIDFLTQHYYVVSKLKDGNIQNPEHTLFAPSKMEAHLRSQGNLLAIYNKDRANNPIRLSIDEWNNRHSVLQNNEYKFTRQSPRRQFDVAVAAGMLNVFIRQSPTVGMANYIFPVNGHGLIRTVGTSDALITPLFHLFKQYRQWMTGAKLNVTVNGPGISGAIAAPTIDGDCKEVQMNNEQLAYIDAAAVQSTEGTVYVSLVNRSSNTRRNVAVALPDGYRAVERWELQHTNINAFNDPENRDVLVPKIRKVSGKKGGYTATLLPCAVMLLKLEKK